MCIYCIGVSTTQHRMTYPRQTHYNYLHESFHKYTITSSIIFQWVSFFIFNKEEKKGNRFTAINTHYHRPVAIYFSFKWILKYYFVFQSRERRKKLERGASFSSSDGERVRPPLHRGLSEQLSAPITSLQNQPLTEVSSSNSSLDRSQQQSPDSSSRK